MHFTHLVNRFGIPKAAKSGETSNIECPAALQAGIE